MTTTPNFFLPGVTLCMFLTSISPGGMTCQAAVLFEDDFNRGIPGWTAVQPPGVYFSGPLRWQYDIVSGGFVEQSNIYTDDPTASLTAITPMLINDTVTDGAFTLNARLTAGDDDGFGLIFGYQNETNFYRVTFARQTRTGFPWTGWCVDRKVDGITSNLFGAGTPGYVQSFVNTANRPFDVFIAVDASNRLSLTVVDSPTSAPITHLLVTGQPLPAPANGKVGLMTWGMSGGVPRGFRIQNVNLAPAVLAGNPNALADWTPVVPPRANGSTSLTSGHGQPLWSLSVGTAAPFGTLLECGDCFAGNDAAGQVDFTGPTIVAGDDNWTDYALAARITPDDDDGHGILLRYQNPTNFYRVGLRSQESALGAPRGLSVQKNVNGTYTEVFRESAALYAPLPGVPYDLVAAIAGNKVEVLVVADPEGAALPYAYGPFTLTGVPAGSMGLFSWAMAKVDFDRVSVQDGTPLYVSSSFGSPEPGRGLQSFAPASTVTASAGPAIEEPGVRRFPLGWTGSGSVPASGAGSNLVFRLTTFSRLQWLWQTQYHLAVTNGPGGTVSFPPGEWFNAGSTVSLTAHPEPGFTLARWTGDAVSTAPTFNLVMDQPYTLTAIFTADIDADGLPDDWEMGYFGSLTSLPGADPDRDGRTNQSEYYSGTDPLVADVFRIESLQLANSQAVLTVSNDTGSRYSVQQTLDPAGNWTTIATTQFSTTFASAVPAGQTAFWRLQQPGHPAQAVPFVPGSWTLVVLPDTQVYSAVYPELFKDQIRWILANRNRRNIKYVLHLGDVTNNNLPDQWANAQAALSMLDGIVPYAFVPGNHDYGLNGGTADRTTYLNDYFPFATYAPWPTLGGVMEPNKMDNSYHLFSAGGVDWLVLALEFGPRNSVVTWANSIVNTYPNRKAILITHAYLYNDDTRYDWPAKGPSQSWNPYAYNTASDPDGTNDGEDLWRKLVQIHPNFVFTINGHVLNDGLGRLSSSNNFGNVVHQMLVNYQINPLGGEAVLRLLEFLPDGKTVQVKSFSPLYGTYKTDPQNNFTLTLQPPL